ncbi:MAG: cation:proton antiporter [Bacteroidales bacterium]
MHVEFHLLKDIVIIFALASFVIWLFHKLKIPAIIGFLLTGVLTGPHAFGLVQSVDEIEVLAEIGVVLLLFTIGIEFSLKNLIKSRRVVFIGGFLQVFLTGGITTLISYLAGRNISESVFFGFLVALSSTAVVLKVLQERAEVGKEYGSFSVGILIFQDLIIVPMILVIPLLAGDFTSIGQDIGTLIVKVAGVLSLTWVGARFFVPWMLHQVARTKSQELFLLTVLMFGLAVAWLTSTIGLSLALGAFLAGLIISESDYSHQAFGNILPLRDIFISFFFVSIGMLFDLSFVINNPIIIIIAALVVLLLKTFISGFVAFILGFPFKTTVMAGLALSQVGEFSFVLAQMGSNYKLIDANFFQVFITVSVLTMALSPFIIKYSSNLAIALGKLPLPSFILREKPVITSEKAPSMGDHLVIIGMGLHGQNVALAAERAGINHLILDNDPDIVRSEKQKGKKIFFGNASHSEVLKQVSIENAEVIVITPSNSASVYSITELCREMNPRAHIIVRARHLIDVNELYNLGANEIIPEEFETSVEIFSRVLAKYLVPRTEIEKLITELRSDGYEALRNLSITGEAMQEMKIHFHDLEVTAISVHENSSLVNRSISDIRLRTDFGLSIIAVRRDDENIINPDAKTMIRANDTLYVLGTPYQIACATSLFEEGVDPDCAPES